VRPGSVPSEPAIRRLLAAGIAVPAAVLMTAAAGCGDYSTNGRRPRTVDVDVVDFAFDPAQAAAQVGDTVRWTQRGNVFHTVTEGVRGAPVPGGFDGAVSDPGDTFTVVVTEPGTLEYFCVPHPGMDGRVVVTR
jgi:plastocyanin